ncbi:MAG: hypothetical protein DRP85_03220 [Candidatus Makaraimicrobium thalassicum]|nr:MAG: hypothetical protein DRP85_03220 [Candidatus Omnitrophota bacterium]
MTKKNKVADIELNVQDVETEAESLVEAIFQENIELTEDEIVLAIYTETELGLKEATAQYRKLAIEAGLIFTPAQRKEEWKGKVEGVDLADPEGMEFAKSAAKEIGITPVTADKYIREKAAEDGFEMPEIVKTNSKWKEVLEGFTEEEVLEGDKDEVMAKLAELGQYDEKQTKANYNRLRRAFGWEAPASMSSQLNTWFVDHLDATRDEIIAKGTEVGMTEGSATYYVGIYKIVNELIVELESR